MVAGPFDHPDRTDRLIHRAGRFDGAGAFYLFSILIYMSKNYKAKETVLGITVGLLVLYVVFRGRGFLYCALGIGLAGVFSYDLSGKIDWLWTRLARVMAAVSNSILLSLVFFLLVTPVALVRRWRKKDVMRRFDPKATSNFSDREHGFTAKDFEKTW